MLFHVSASPGWSSLPLSGLYVEMLRRIVGAVGRRARTPTEMGDRRAAVPLSQTLDGFGHLRKPAGRSAADPKASDLDNVKPRADHPPGLYGNEGA